MTAPALSPRDQLIARARTSFAEHKGADADYLCPIHREHLCWTFLEAYAMLRDAGALRPEDDIFLTGTRNQLDKQSLP